MEFLNFQPELCHGYERIFERSVGGFLYIGFVPGKDSLLCISSDYISVIDLRNGQKIIVDGDYDEESLLAYYDGIEEPVRIAGQYGGSLLLTNQYGTEIQTHVDRSGPYPICSIFWKMAEEKPSLIFKSYLPYIYGFSADGRYYLHTDDGGLTVLRKKEN